MTALAVLAVYGGGWAIAGYVWGVYRERWRTRAALIAACRDADEALDAGRVPGPAEVLRCVASHAGIAR